MNTLPFDIPAGRRWIPSQRASNVDIWPQPHPFGKHEHTVEQSVELSVIWDAKSLELTLYLRQGRLVMACHSYFLV